jgi:hypothetical protein
MSAPPRGSARPQPSWTACQKHPTSRPGPPSPGGSSPTSGAAGRASTSPSCATADDSATSPPCCREPAPILRLRYQGSADRWAIGIYLASSDRYTESELPTSFGPKTGTPEEGVDDTFILYAGPKTGRLRPSARTRPRPQECETRDKSHSHQASSARRLLIEAGYSLRQLKLDHRGNDLAVAAGLSPARINRPKIVEGQVAHTSTS